MIFINPWASYDPDDIPDLTPRSDEEMAGCLGAACGCIISSVIYAFIFYLCFNLTEGLLRCILVLIDSAVIYPILMIYLVKLSFKIVDKIYKRKRNEKLHRHKTKQEVG